MGTTARTAEDSDFEALFAFRSAIRRFLAFSEQAARSAGVEPQQHQLLLAIRAAPGRSLRLADIAVALWIRHNTAVELVDRTAAHGLVVRERSEADRREVRVSLTAEGERVLLELTRYHRDELRREGPTLVAALRAAVASAEGAAVSAVAE